MTVPAASLLRLCDSARPELEAFFAESEVPFWRPKVYPSALKLMTLRLT